MSITMLMTMYQSIDFVNSITSLNVENVYSFDLLCLGKTTNLCVLSIDGSSLWTLFTEKNTSLPFPCHQLGVI